MQILTKKHIAVLCGALLAGALTAQTLYPANGAREAAYDAQLVLTFDTEPELVAGSFITIYDASGATADTIAFTDGEQVFADGTKVAVGSQLVRKVGKSVYIQPHYGSLVPNATYSVEIPAGAIKAGGASDGIAKGAWTFTTKAAPAPANDGATLTVNNSTDNANDAQFHSIQAALDFVKNREGTFTISLAPATYYELLHYNGTANIILQGPKGNKRGDDTIITYINCNDMNSGQTTRVSFLFTGANLTLENLTLINATNPTKVYLSTQKVPTGNAQAETLFFYNGKGHTLNAYNCSFKSLQDTMQISGKCWFYDCYVEGDVDYVWGTADVALFEECDFHSVYSPLSRKDRAYIFETRVGTTEEPLVGKGYVLYNSRVEVDQRQNAYYGRRATAVTSAKKPYYDQCAIVNVEFFGKGNIGEQRWYVGKEPRVIDGSKHVGWKEYNVSFKKIEGTKPADTSKRYKDAGDLDKKTYKTEYATRDLIMNRVYNTKTGAYEDDAAPWDINQLARDRGYNTKNIQKENPILAFLRRLLHLSPQ